MTLEAMRLAIVWDKIERLAFKPDSRARWLAVYERTLHSLWEVQAADVNISRSLGFDAFFLNLRCRYFVEAADKYSVSIVNISSESPSVWCLEADPMYPSKAAFYTAPGKYPAQAREKNLRKDVARVLDGMIFHPRTHAHVDKLGISTELGANGLGLQSHEVRLGGGIENAFVFLTHLRYQFCLLSHEARDTEKSRLVNLFSDAIHAEKTVVPPADLFDLKG